MPASSSRYKLFSTHRFRNAPFSKFWACCTFAGSCALIPLREYKPNFLLVLPAVQNGHNLFFLDVKDIVAGCCLMYSMRVLERRMGTRNYANFIILSTLTATVIEIILLSIISFYFDSSQIPYLASGPYAALCSALVQFVFDVPYVSFASLFNIPLSEKNIPCFLALLLIISSKESRLACIAGLFAGFLYKIDFLSISKISLIPRWFASYFDSITERLQGLGEDHKGRVLPIGATLETQRQEIMDHLEQRMIYEQLRRQHVQDQQRGGMFLNAARRFFGSPVQTGNATLPAAQEEKVRALTEMGFNNRQRVVEVLRSTGNDLNAAAHILLQQDR